MSVKFTDNRVKIKAAMSDALISFLYEAAGEIQAAVQRNTRVDTGKTKNSWSYVVDESSLEATIGSPEENAIWEEFGTGEYAIEGNGRKGGWYIPAEKLSAKAKSRMKEVHGVDGKVYYYTTGKKPSRAFQKAYDSNKKSIEKRCSQILKGGMS